VDEDEEDEEPEVEVDDEVMLLPVCVDDEDTVVDELEVVADTELVVVVLVEVFFPRERAA
jgi:hypothetical protein